jgi:hypothetical protein
VTAFPRLLVSSVVRGSQQGDSHGGVYLVDLNAQAAEQVLDWNDGSIDFEGRGGDRGLRGIVIVGEEIFLAASDELFVFDRQFRRKVSYRNAYLKHCHEMSLHGGKLYLTSTGFDALLRMDLASRRFDLGMKLSSEGGAVNVRAFDPNAAGGPAAGNLLHINNVHVDESGVFASGRNLPALVQITRTAVGPVAPLPKGTHNARPFRGGVLFNDTDSDAVVWARSGGRVAVPVPRHDPEALTHVDADEFGIARQGFGRGLCVLSERLVAAGSSPTTVAVHDIEAGRQVTQLNVTMDVRNAAHGIAVWPF